MTKKNVMISLDDDLHKLSKDMNLNLSAELNRLLNEHLKSSKKSNCPEDNLQVICKLCKKIIERGFYCNSGKIIICEECQKNYPMEKCDIQMNEHMHIKWGDWNEDIPTELSKILEKEKLNTYDNNNTISNSDDQ
jgi:post-segregation antitoxin (ccd killing protein)